jgi:hypothetical protein
MPDSLLSGLVARRLRLANQRYSGQNDRVQLDLIGSTKDHASVVLDCNKGPTVERQP